MAFYQLDILHWSMWWIILLSLIIYVGATNVINFMDGINGITAGYALAVLVTLALVNMNGVFVEQSLIISTILASLVFCFFNFRPRGKARCFAGALSGTDSARMSHSCEVEMTCSSSRSH